MMAAQELITAELARHGWAARRQEFEYSGAAGYLDLGTLRRGQWGPHAYTSVAGSNLVATRDGSENGSGSLIVLAHLDTPRDVPGADDNGAAVALLLELARIHKGTSFKRSVTLAFVDMEEIGLFGSRALVEQLADRRPPLGAIIFDSVAYVDPQPGAQRLPPGLGLLYPRLVRRLRRRGLRGDWAGVIYRASSVGMASVLADEMARRRGADSVVLLRDPVDLPFVGPLLRTFAPFVREFGRSDHLSFWRAGIPALVVSDTTYFRNPNYHEATDTPDTLDYEWLAALTDATAAAMLSLAGAKPGAPSQR